MEMLLLLLLLLILHWGRMLLMSMWRRLLSMAELLVGLLWLRLLGLRKQDARRRGWHVLTAAVRLSEEAALDDGRRGRVRIDIPHVGQGR
jgi:hypothetical protein